MINGPHHHIDHPATQHPREIEASAAWRAYLFGPFRVCHGQIPLSRSKCSRKKALQLLQWFLLHPRQPFQSEQLVELLWPNSEPSRGMTSLHVSVHSLRQLLDVPGPDPRTLPSCIRLYRQRLYSFEPAEEWWTDAQDAERLFKRATGSERQGDWDKASFYYTRIVNYYTQGFLPEVTDSDYPWVTPYRERYRVMCREALSRLMNFYAASGNRELLLETAYQMLQIDRSNSFAARVISPKFHGLSEKRWIRSWSGTPRVSLAGRTDDVRSTRSCGDRTGSTAAG